MKKTKRIFVVLVFCAFVLLSAIPVGAFTIPDQTGYLISYIFAGPQGSAPSSRTKIAEFTGNIRFIAASDSNAMYTRSGIDVWWDSSGNIDFYVTTGELIAYYSAIDGSIKLSTTSWYSMLFIYLSNAPNILNQELFDRAFIENPELIFDNGYNNGFQEGYRRGEESGYTQGSAAGREQGYQLGYADGQAAAAEGDFKDGYDAALKLYGSMGVKNLFSYLDLELTWYASNGDLHKVKTRPDVYGNRISFETAVSDLENYCRAQGIVVPPSPNMNFYFHENLEENEIVMTVLFTDALIVVENGFPPDSSVNDTQMWLRYTNDQGQYPDETYNPVGLSTVDGVTGFRGGSAPLNVYSFSIVSSYDYSLSNLRLLTDIFISNQGYQSGYLAGFTAGFEANSAQNAPFIQEAYDRGYNMGYQIGKADGFELGNTGFFDLCFAVAQAPLDVLYGVFDFEILGFNMQAAIGSLATVCVVVIMVKFLLFFL